MSYPMRRRLPVAIVFILIAGSLATGLRARQAPGEVIEFTPERWDLANARIRVTLVEKSPSLGGRMAQLDKTFPTMDCSI